jgi:hypothetical protein
MPDLAWSVLAQNGPWAVVAGFLLWTVIKAWNSDRDQVTKLLGDFKDALSGLQKAVEHLTERLDRLDGK